MKNIRNNKKVRNLISLIFMAVLAVTMTACGGGNKKGAGPHHRYNRHYPCTNCSGSPLASGLGESVLGSTDSIQLALDFYSASANTGTHGLNDVEATGLLYINQFNGFGLCHVPPGVYSVSTIHKGIQNSLGQIGNLTLRATGPANLEMRVVSFVFLSAQPQRRSCSGEFYPSDMLGEVEIIRVEGPSHGHGGWQNQNCSGKRLIVNGSQNNFSCRY